MTTAQRFQKRTLDVLCSLLGLAVLWPLILLLALAAYYETGKNGFFLQQRIGQNGKRFNIIKLRTMYATTQHTSTVTSKNDPRITRLGSLFRKYKLDELPQLWNVLVGDMSFVGPRPDVPGFADKLCGEDRIILSIRPGITGPASIAFKDEEILLAQQQNPEHYNQTVLWPQKVQINKLYIQQYSFIKDIKLIWHTIWG